MGIFLLVGCIPFPSTQQYMINGKKVPKYVIGTKADSLVRLGETKIDDAMDVLSAYISGGKFNGVLRTSTEIPTFASRWSFMIVDGGRRYVLPYSRRSGYTIYPFCFMAEPIADRDFLALDLDERGIVIGFKTSHDPTKVGLPADWQRWRRLPATTRAAQPTTPP